MEQQGNSSWIKKLLAEVNDISATKLLKWAEIIERLGLDSVNLNDYSESVKNHVESLYDDMIEEMEAHQNSVIEEIEQLLKEASALCKHLSIPIPMYGEEELSLIKEREILRKKISEYQAEVDARTTEFQALLDRQEKVCKALGQELEEFKKSPLPTAKVLNDFRAYIEELELEKSQRHEKLREKKAQIIQIVQELKIIPSLEFERNVLADDDEVFLVTDSNMKQLDEYYVSLVEQKEKIKDDIANLRSRVEELWKIIDEDMQTRDAFRQEHVGNSCDTLQALQDEVKRCEELRKANIQIFVERLRSQLTKHWDIAHYTDAQREEFKFFNINIYTEDLLELHDREINKVQNYYNNNKEIFMLLEQHAKLWEKLLGLEERAARPDRFKNRGGQLLQEEKERNALSKKIPVIEQKLKELGENYLLEHGTSFLTWGKTIPMVIEETHKKRDEEKKLKLSARKQQRENMTVTPGKSALSLFPSTSTQNLRQTPYSATKRKILATPVNTTGKRARLASNKENKGVRTGPPIIKINDRTRRSLERVKKLVGKKRHSKTGVKKEKLDSSSDYDAFVQGTAARSTTFVKEEDGAVSPLAQPLATTPKRTPLKLLTPHTANTKSPSSKLTAASPLKLIF